MKLAEFANNKISKNDWEGVQNSPSQWIEDYAKFNKYFVGTIIMDLPVFKHSPGSNKRRREMKDELITFK